jgi:hypothetical protein
MSATADGFTTLVRQMCPRLRCRREAIVEFDELSVERAECVLQVLMVNVVDYALDTRRTSQG